MTNGQAYELTRLVAADPAAIVALAGELLFGRALRNSLKFFSEKGVQAGSTDVQ